MADRGSVEAVCDFLTERGVEVKTVDLFRTEKFDCAAVQYSTEASLKELGLKLGDVYSLKAFADRRLPQDEKPQENREDRKRKLLDQLFKKADNSKPKRSARKLPRFDNTSSEKQKTRRILLGMMSYDEKKKKYTRVSLVKGGGTRKVDLPLHFKREDVIEYGVKLFFPGSEYAPGSSPDVIYELANFKQEPVSNLVDSNGTIHEFTIQKYCELCKTHQFNLYLLVKEKRGDVDDEDDEDLLKPVFSIPMDEESPNLSLETEWDITELQPVVNSTVTSSEEEEVFQASSETLPVNHHSGRNRNVARREPSSTCTSTVTTLGEEASLHCNLIGSSSERLQLREEQKNMYEESLKADQEKESRKRVLESLRSARLARVPPEPDEKSTGEKVKISIRHPAMGAVSRNFLREESMLAVYDWCGSLSSEPEFFGLYTTLPRTFISPCEPVTSVASNMLYVEEQSSPVSLSDDELEVSLRGFGVFRPDLIFEGHDTILIEGDDISESRTGLSSRHMQVHLPVEDISDDYSRALSISEHSPIEEGEGGRWFRRNAERIAEGASMADMDGQKQILTERRAKLRDELFDTCEVRKIQVSREGILESVLQLYETSPEIVPTMLMFTLEGEQGLDMDGVKREVFSSFWERALEKFFEGHSTFVPRVGPDVQDSHYKTIGRVISHCYLLTGMFPAAISKVFITALLAGKDVLSADDYISGFLEHVSQYDSMRLESALALSVFPDEMTQFLIELFSEYGVVQTPTPASLKNILVSVAKTELIARPSVALNEIRSGMFEGKYEELWGDCRKEDVDDLYDNMMLTTSKVLQMIQVIELDETTLSKPQAQVLQFLKQYIRNLFPKELQLFFRYLTGSSLPVVNNISVIFHAHVGAVPLVFIHTCSATIDLPDGGYTGFQDFRVQMENTLRSPEAWLFTSP